MLHGSHLPRFLTLTEMKYLYLYVAIHKQYTIVFFSLCMQLSNTACFFVQRESPWGTSCRGTQESQSSQSRPYPPAISRPFIPGTSRVLQTKQGLYVLSNIFLTSTMSIVHSHLVDHVLYLGLWRVLTKLPHHSAYLIAYQVKTCLYLNMIGLHRWKFFTWLLDTDPSLLQNLDLKNNSFLLSSTHADLLGEGVLVLPNRLNR